MIEVFQIVRKMAVASVLEILIIKSITCHYNSNDFVFIHSDLIVLVVYVQNCFKFGYF